MEIDVVEWAARSTVDPPVWLRGVGQLGPRRGGRSATVSVGVCAVEPVIGHRRMSSLAPQRLRYQRSEQECAMYSILASPSLAIAHNQIADPVAQGSPSIS